MPNQDDVLQQTAVANTLLQNFEASELNLSVNGEKLGTMEFNKGYKNIGSETSAAETEKEENCAPNVIHGNTVVVISADHMGEGDEELGKVLIKGFIYALTEQDVLPQTILFYNGGAKLTCEESPTLEDLKSLEAQGVEILTCGTCLNHYGLTDKLQVGSVTNMYVIAEKMTQAGNIVKP
jgi:selenium metabolism protein YedF